VGVVKNGPALEALDGWQNSYTRLEERSGTDPRTRRIVSGPEKGELGVDGKAGRGANPGPPGPLENG